MVRCGHGTQAGLPGMNSVGLGLWELFLERLEQQMQDAPSLPGRESVLQHDPKLPKTYRAVRKQLKSHV